MQQKDDTTVEKENTSTAVCEGAVDANPDQVGEANVETTTSRDNLHPPVKVETTGIDPTIGNSDNKVCVFEGQRPVDSTLEKENSPKDVTIEEPRTIDVDDANTVETGAIEQGDAVSTKPSKEEILSTIDILDLDIAGVKKQIKALQRTIVTTEVKQEASLQQVDMEIMAAVKVAVDSRFVELLADVFSENLRKSTTANAQLPKRIEHALSDQVRLKVRKRNRARHEYMKKLAKDYMDLKKTWKLGVKKLEKDRKRQDKLRLKQLQKQKLKSMGESEGTIVRTSSRLTNNSSADLENNDLEKIEQAKAQALIDQEVRKKRLKNALSTVIPDMLITPVERKQRYFTRFVNKQSCMADGLVTDWKLKEKAEMKVNPWNDLEK
ncbi:hypothetical protein PHPALM_31693, partial [Phytophthora palmivora]